MSNWRPRTKHELRCFCSRSPMLAMYGIGNDEKLFIHVMVHKQSRIFGNLVFRGGLVELQCRECLRWHKITIMDKKAELTPHEEPPELEEQGEAA